jgi:antagonist of KipI
MAELHIITPGMLTTVQDVGRWGFQARGVPVAGPMDAYAHRLANALVGNPVAAATLEITLVGPEIEFDDDRVVAVTGARFEVTRNGESMPMRTAVAVPAGSRVKFGRRSAGARAYLAVAGGIAVRPVLGSRATHVITAMGGVDGRSLRAGDRLPLGPPGGAAPPRRQFAEDPADDYLPTPAVLRILAGPHRDYFAGDALRVLQSAPYSVGGASDRMAFRLDGAPVSLIRTHMISDATTMGALQVPPSGLPILLMADRQTTGGYPQLAVVATADLRIAAQLAPGDAVSFVVCSPAVALTALIAQERALMTVEP